MDSLRFVRLTAVLNKCIRGEVCKCTEEKAMTVGIPLNEEPVPKRLRVPRQAQASLRGRLLSFNVSLWVIMQPDWHRNSSMTVA